jgi:hypothetical protein
MPKKRIKISVDGTPHDASPAEWKRTSPLIVAGTVHDNAPTGTLQLGLGAGFKRKVAVRTNDAGELFLEFDIK